MPDKLYVDEPWQTLRWDDLHGCVYSEWKAFANSAEFRAGLIKGLQAAGEHQATRYLSDTRKIKVIVHADQEWVRDTWAPLAAAAGIKRVALVTAAAGLGKITTEEITAMVDTPGLVLHHFASLVAARQWLAEI
jgi:hypothetical protein